MELTDIEKNLILHIFHNWAYEIDGVEANTFRVSHNKHLDLITKLNNRGLITKKSQAYFAPFASLLFLEHDEINQFIKNIEPIYSQLRNDYISNPKGSTTFLSLEKLFNSDEDDYKKAIRYLHDSNVINCYPDNLFEKDVSTYYSESILKHESYMGYLKWRTNVQFQLEKPSIKKPGNTESNARKRLEILGAAIAIIANFPKECTYGDSIKGKRVYNLMHSKAKTWWENGEPPLKDEAAIKLINKWLNTLQ